MNKRHYEHTLPNIRGSLSNTYDYPWSRREAGKDIPGQMDLPVEGTAYRAAGM